jgi:PhoH-like ATPase
LEELDKFKLGNDTKNFSAREVIRFIDKLSTTNLLQEWISLGLKKGKFKIVMDYHPENLNAEHIYSSQKNDHKIINAALVLQEQEPKKKGCFSYERHQFKN